MRDLFWKIAGFIVDYSLLLKLCDINKVEVTFKTIKIIEPLKEIKRKEFFFCMPSHKMHNGTEEWMNCLFRKETFCAPEGWLQK